MMNSANFLILGGLQQSYIHVHMIYTCEGALLNG